VIDKNLNGAYWGFPIDMDKDGDLDVLSASKNADLVALQNHTQ